MAFLRKGKKEKENSAKKYKAQFLLKQRRFLCRHVFTEKDVVFRLGFCL